MTEIATTVARGLPCIARLTRYRPGRQAIVSAPVERCHPAEPEEIGFELLTLKGKPAEWISRAATQADLERIEEELSAALRDELESYEYIEE